jgi:hypothetical protein
MAVLNLMVSNEKLAVFVKVQMICDKCMPTLSADVDNVIGIQYIIHL